MIPKKGLSQLCFPKSTSVKRIIELAHKAGFEGVEFKTNIDSEIRFDSSREDVRKIYSLLKDYSLEGASVSNGANWSHPLSSLDENVRKKGIEYVKKTIDVAYWLEADTILLVPGNVTKDTRYDLAWKNSLDAVVEAGKHAVDRGVTIAIEEVWNKLIFTPFEMERFVEEANKRIGEKIIGVYFDTANILPFGYPEHWITYLGKKIKRIHIKDFRGENPSLVYSVFPPYGSVDWPKVMNALKEIGYDSFLTAEIPISNIVEETAAQYISNMISDLIKLAWK